MIVVDNVTLENKPLTNLELMQACKQLKIPIRGIYMRDNLPSKCMRDEYAIINLGDSFGSGTHWTCYAKQGKKKVYFDSFGLTPPLELQKYLGKMSYSTYQVQLPEQVICGHLCLYVLNRLKKPNKSSIKHFEKVIQNLI